LFVPIFLTRRVATDLAEELDLKEFGALEIKVAKQLRKILTLAGTNNAAVYFKKRQTRFYRVDDLLEELESPARN